MSGLHDMAQRLADIEELERLRVEVKRLRQEPRDAVVLPSYVVVPSEGWPVSGCSFEN